MGHRVEVGVYLDQDVGPGSLKGPDRLGNVMAWIWGWLRDPGTLEIGWGHGGRGPLNPAPGDAGMPETRA